jgi:hypothetical protein
MMAIDQMSETDMSSYASFPLKTLEANGYDIYAFSRRGSLNFNIFHDYRL